MLRSVSDVSPAKSPFLSEVIPWLNVPKPKIPNSVIEARFATVTAAQSSTPEISARITSWIFCVRSQMPGVGVTGPAMAASPSPAAFTARSSKVWASSLVSPVTMNPPSFAPPSALSAIAVQVRG